MSPAKEVPAPEGTGTTHEMTTADQNRKSASSLSEGSDNRNLPSGESFELLEQFKAKHPGSPDPFGRNRHRRVARQPVKVKPVGTVAHRHVDGGAGFCRDCDESMAWLAEGGRP
jgi:hypothetical protein